MNKEHFPTNPVIIISITIFFILIILGRLPSTNLVDSAYCYKFIGCGNGFFGYDFIQHLLSGLTEALCILWISERYQNFNIFGNSFWKNALILIACIALIGVFWEMSEFMYDHIRISFFNLHVTKENLAQPTNTDTMGDLTGNLIGPILLLIKMRVSKTFFPKNI